MIVVGRGERRGTWRIGLRCAGTLRLKDISSGYHHYYRVGGARDACAALGVDCLKRVGAQMVDVFVPELGAGRQRQLASRPLRGDRKTGSPVRECLNCAAAAGCTCCVWLCAAGGRDHAIHCPA